MKIRLISALILLLCIAASCRKPTEMLDFIYTPSNAPDTFVFRYEMMMDEPQAAYSARIACRYDASRIKAESIPLLVGIVSPSGERAMERIEMPLASDGDRIKVQHSGGAVVDIDWPYRDRILPGEDTGTWQVVIRPMEHRMLRHIYGMGFSYKRTAE
ncbi:MAG: hypothetical protein J5699_09260 [Bacteroidales bacterium]|nr:hypothetical protein [Bacteroidales bacterium]